MESLRSGRLFRDDKFPPTDKSLGFKNKQTQIKWIRAKGKAFIRNTTFQVIN